MLRPFWKIGRFTKLPVIMQKDQIRGHIAKWPKFLNILQNDQDFGQFTKLSLVSLQNVHTASSQMEKKWGNDKT